MPETDTNGLHKNISNVLNANDLILSEGRIINDPKYNGGEAIICQTPGVEVCKTPVYPKGTFSGTYSIGFFYESSTATTQGTELLRFEIYKDGVLLTEDTTYYSGPNKTLYQYDLNYIDNLLDYGLFQNIVFNASSEYQIIIKTSPNLSNDAILDYIIFNKIPSNSITDGKPVPPIAGLRDYASTRNIATYGTQLVIEEAFGELTGSITSGSTFTPGYTYNTKFKTIIGAYPTIMDSAGKLNVNWSSTDYTNSQVLLYIRNNSSVTWNHDTSNTDNVRILIIGYI